MAPPDLTVSLAAWGTAVPLPAPGKGRRLKPSFLEKTVSAVADLLGSSVFVEKVANGEGWLQGLDPRTKVLIFLMLVLTATMSRSLPTLLGLYTATLALALLSRIPLGYFLKRAWVLVPLFTGLIAFPAMFNWVTPGEAVVVLAHWGRKLTWGPLVLPDSLALTRQGLGAAAYLILRVGTCVSLAMLLTLTTPWDGLLKALRVLRVPQLFVLLLATTHRYIYLLLQTMEAMFLARRSRMVGHLSPAEHRRWLARTAVLLLDKSYTLSEQVYLAMVARGFRGEIPWKGALPLKFRDWACLTGILVTALGVFFLEWIFGE